MQKESNTMKGMHPGGLHASCICATNIHYQKQCPVLFMNITTSLYLFIYIQNILLFAYLSNETIVLFKNINWLNVSALLVNKFYQGAVVPMQHIMSVKKTGFLNSKMH